MRILAAALLFITPACAAEQPYSLADIVTICHQHEHFGQRMVEGAPVTAIMQDKGFEHCRDLYQWYADSLNDPRRIDGDRQAVEALYHQFGPAPKRNDPVHVK